MDRELVEQRLLVAVEQVVAPVEHLLEAARGVRRLPVVGFEPALEQGEELREPEHVHTGSGELDRERKTVEPSADLGGVASVVGAQREARTGRSRSLGEEPDGVRRDEARRHVGRPRSGSQAARAEVAPLRWRRGPVGSLPARERRELPPASPRRCVAPRRPGARSRRGSRSCRPPRAGARARVRGNRRPRALERRRAHPPRHARRRLRRLHVRDRPARPRPVPRSRARASPRGRAGSSPPREALSRSRAGARARGGPAQRAPALAR